MFYVFCLTVHDILSVGSAAKVAEQCKCNLNDAKCADMCWCCIPKAVEMYGYSSPEAEKLFFHLATSLALWFNATSPICRDGA